jgi:hypothetical protein
MCYTYSFVIGKFSSFWLKDAKVTWNLSGATSDISSLTELHMVGLDEDVGDISTCTWIKLSVYSHHHSCQFILQQSKNYSDKLQRWLLRKDTKTTPTQWSNKAHRNLLQKIMTRLKFIWNCAKDDSLNYFLFLKIIFNIHILK